ncbi:hypothetical protein JCM10021v2_007160 [Rhodotorula toruloides]
MDPLKPPHEHIKQIANHPAAVPVDSASPHLDFSRPNQSLPPASALSATRPVDLTTPPSCHGEPRTVLASPALPASASSPTESSQSSTPAPVLLSTLSASDGESILCIAVEAGEVDAGSGTPAKGEEGKDGNRSRARKNGREGRVYGGSQGGDIHVWDLETLSLRARLTGHEGAVLALQVVPAFGWLISASGDGTVRVWDTRTLSLLYLIHPPHDNIGDILSIAWVPSELLDEDEHAGHRRGREVPGTSGRRRGTGRLYAGCQDTSIQWIDLPPTPHPSTANDSSASHPSPVQSPHHPHSHASSHSYFSSSPLSHSPPIYKAPNKFFDSISQADKNRARALGSRRGSGDSLNTLGKSLKDSRPATPNESGAGQANGAGQAVELQFQAECITPFAHFGYVYCLLVGKSNDRSVLMSGSGDESVKLWRPTTSDLLPIATLSSTGEDCDAVLALATKDNTLFAGHQGGVVRVWDLDTLTCVRVLRPHEHDVLALSVLSSSLYASCANGWIKQWDLRTFKLENAWEGHKSIVLSSEVCRTGRGGWLLTGGNDASLKVWDLRSEDTKDSVMPADRGFQGELFHTLANFVAIKTIADDAHREDCRQGALYLKRALRGLGAETVILPGAPEKNPIVLSTFRANAPPRPNRFEAPRRKRVLFYGHYDVVPASAPDVWTNDPFTMAGKDGWLYGRGVSDNKGPVLAVAAAAAELRRRQEMEVDLVMLMEGEEETGSAGFQEAVRKNRGLIGNVDVILVSNSYWLGEDVPCLTFGLRGVIHASVKVSPLRGLPPFVRLISCFVQVESAISKPIHSGIEGGATSEPLNDLIRVIAGLTDADGRVRIPGFLDDVRKMSPNEQKLYEKIVERYKNLNESAKLASHSAFSDPLKALINRWRQPALSVHNVEVPGPAQKSLIPNSASAAISIRIVPDQSLDDIVAKLKSHLEKSFRSLRTQNKLSVEINHVADWWLGDLDSPFVSAMADCISSQWKLDPLFIREGGSIPSLPFLEREFAADAIHFPMGTSTDSAHLPDERIRVLNLENGKAIVSAWFSKIASFNL